MGLFEKIFGNKIQSVTQSNTRYELISDSGNGFYSWNGNLYQSDIVRACIRPKAKAIGKLIAKHIRSTENEFKINPEVNIRFLLEEPNPLMTGQMLQEKLANQLELNNNAFAYIKRDDEGEPVEIYPLPCTTVEAVKGVVGDLFLKFTFKNGKHMTVPYSDIIHLRKDFNDHDIFGDSPREPLINLMETVNTTDQGVVKAIKSSAVVKWILKFTQVLKPEDKQIQVKEFEKNYLSIEEGGGAAASDPRYELQQVKPENYVPNASQMKETVQRIHSFFNTNEKIIQSKYNEDEWNAYYESEIEPVSMQLSGEYTRKLFSKTKRGHGNKIIFEASNLQHASMRTKLDLLKMVDRGAMTPNQWRRVMNLGPIENGDQPIRRLDTALVKEGGEEDGESGAKRVSSSEN